MSIKHTILMITYNQEKYIRETLDCLFRQGVLPYEVFIADDCSTDNTRKIILEYKEKYPEIIKPIFHKKNLGIYQNLNYIINNVKVNGDMISFLSGDDLYEDNMLIEFNNFIKANNLNPLEEKFLLMSNVLSLDVNNKKKIILNNELIQNKEKYEILKLRLRNKINTRCTGISKKLYKEWGLFNLNIGLWADFLHSFDLYIKCEKFYFLNKSFPVYRLGSGVTSSKKKEIFYKSWIQVANYILKNREEYLDKQDKIYLKKTIIRAKMYFEPNIKNYFNLIKYHLLSFGDVLSGYNDIYSYGKESIGILLPTKIKNIIKKMIRK